MTATQLTFTDGYDLDRKIEDFLAQRSSAIAAGSSSAREPVLVDLVGLSMDDRRVSVMRASATTLGLRLRFC